MGMELICILVVIFVVVTPNFAQMKKSGGKTSSPQKKSAVVMPSAGNKVGKAHHGDLCKAATVKSYRLGTSGLEDRENDWLAKQLREEAKLKKNMMFE